MHFFSAKQILNRNLPDGPVDPRTLNHILRTGDHKHLRLTGITQLRNLILLAHRHRRHCNVNHIDLLLDGQPFHIGRLAQHRHTHDQLAQFIIRIIQKSDDFIVILAILQYLLQQHRPRLTGPHDQRPLARIGILRRQRRQ